MEETKIVVTAQGKKELEEEYEHLLNVEREQVIIELKAARSQGDLSENADYDAARDHQARVEARIKDLDYMLEHLEIIEETKSSTGRVTLGSTVTIEDQETKEIEVYTIVGTVEADPINGKLSNEAPLAVALMDKKVGDVVTVFVQHPYKVKIKKIK